MDVSTKVAASAAGGDENMSEKRLMTAAETAVYLGIKASTIYTWLSNAKSRRKGKAPPTVPGVVRLGRALRFDREIVDQWINAQRDHAASPQG